MKHKIKEVQDYFKGKLLSGEFVTDKITEHTLTVIIDGTYRFCIWIGNFNIVDTVELYRNGINFIQISFIIKERKKLRSVIKTIVEKHKNEQLLMEKMDQFNRLKKELNIA